MSVRSDALTELRTRLATILESGGFNSDAGAVIFIGETPVAGPGDPDASLAIVVGEDSPGFQGEHVVVDLPVDVQVIVKASTDTWGSWLTVEDIIADVKTAIEIDHDLDGTLIRRGLERGSVTPHDRDSGSEFVGASVRYILKMAETWGAP